MPDILLIFGIIAVVLSVTALLSGVVERSPLSFPLIFLGLGFVLSERGFGVIEIGPHDPLLQIVATLTLSLVLFLDAVKLSFAEVGRRWMVPALVLGPGTVLIITLGAVPLALLLGFGWLLAFTGGAILASTDPVVLREIIRDRRIPRSVRQTLKIEAGTNDIVILPVVLVLIAVAQEEMSSAVGWVGLLARLLLIGPGIGMAIGGLGSWLMTQADKRMGIRREHQALYGIGLVLAAYTAATAAGGDGFLAAFAAGMAVVLLGQRLCDCFLEYGETTSEVAMLLAFVLFGAMLAGIIGTVSIPLALALAAIVILGVRPAVLGIVLARTKMSWEAHALVSWFGPRGLNSLLLALLVVEAGVAGSELLMAAVGVVVLVSVTVHGGTATPFSAWYGRMASRHTLEEEREATAAGLFARHHEHKALVTPQELHTLVAGPNPPVVLDVRSRSSYDGDGAQIPGSVRVLPEEAVEWAADQPNDRLVVAYCA